MAHHPCPVCGLDEDSMAPGDTTATVRSLARRFSGLLRTPGDEDDRPDDVARRPPPDGGPSALALTGGVAALLEATATAEERLLVSDDPEVDPPADVLPAVLDDDASVEAVLGRLADASERLGTVLAGVASGDWTRPGHRADGSGVTVLSLARHAAHLGPHYLRQVERTLREVRGR